MSLADSILQTASIARWVSVADTATDHTIVSGSAQGPGALSLISSPARPAADDERSTASPGPKSSSSNT